MVKCIYVSHDESLMYTGGSDGTIKLWDIGMRSVIATFGKPKQQMGQLTKIADFHSDTINTFIPDIGSSSMGSSLISGSKDGSICRLDILTHEGSRVYQGKESILSLATD